MLPRALVVCPELLVKTSAVFLWIESATLRSPSQSFNNITTGPLYVFYHSPRMTPSRRRKFPKLTKGPWKVLMEINSVNSVVFWVPTGRTLQFILTESRNSTYKQTRLIWRRKLPGIWTHPCFDNMNFARHNVVYTLARIRSCYVVDHIWKLLLYYVQQLLRQHRYLMTFLPQMTLNVIWCSFFSTLHITGTEQHRHKICLLVVRLFRYFLEITMINNHELKTLRTSRVWSSRMISLG